MKILRKVSKVTGYIEMDGNLVLTPADVSREELVKSCEDLTNQTVVLNNRLHKSNDQIKELQIKISGIESVIVDYISDNGKLDNPELKDIADLIDMQLTKTVDIEYTVRYTGSAEIPFYVDVDEVDWDNEVSFHFDTVSEHDIDLSEDSVEVDAREMN
jgi:hypothetical protein